MIGRVDDVACSCQDGEDGESKRDSSYVQGFGGVFRGISLSGSLHSFVRFDWDWFRMKETLREIGLGLTFLALWEGKIN